MLAKEILFGYYETQCLYTVVELGVADYLQAGKQSIVELASMIEVNESKLYRIMRFMASKGLFDELPNQVFQLNPESQCLLSAQTGNIQNFVKMHARYMYQGAAEICGGVINDINPFEKHFGMLAGKYFSANPEAGDIYNKAMKESSEASGKHIVAIYDFSPYKRIIDLGGGLGSLIAHILLKNPAATGINLDLPKLKDMSEQYFREKGVADRCQYLGGNFLEKIPAGGDLYILKAVIHARNDQQSIKILQLCKEAMSKGGRLLIIDRLIESGEHYVDACINDINMLNVTNGKDRTLAEFEDIFKAAGLSLMKVYPLEGSVSIIEVSY